MADPAPDPAPTSSVSAAHIAAATGGTLAIVEPLADMYQYLTTWPLHALTAGQSHSLAILTVAALGGGGLAFFTRNKAPAGPTPAPAPVAPAAPPAQPAA